MLTIDELNHMSKAEFIAALGWIFEDSPWVAERASSERPFGSREALHYAMVNAMEEATPARRHTLLCAHPDLGTRAKVSEASSQEQAGAGLDRLTTDEYANFQEWNRVYREKFGFPFLYAVKGSTKVDIFNALVIRLESSPEDEFHQALIEVSRIAWFRISSTVAD
jgi:2-oxo-4-hydroxy-4-carboxy-5-ureidoimidazoline decarboxylase